MNGAREQWFLLRSGSGPAPANMAIDEALLQRAGQLRRPVLRFYGWSEPAATFGYFQKFAQVTAWTNLRPLIRRPTGGGLVPHERDWTYSLAFPPGHRWHELKAAESYALLHQWIQASFTRLGLKTDLATTPLHEAPGRCFLGAEKADLLWTGKKIAGAAQRRNRLGLLIQGSLQPPEGMARSEWEAALLSVPPAGFAPAWMDLQMDDELKATVEDLSRRKYSQAAYNESR